MCMLYFEIMLFVVQMLVVDVLYMFYVEQCGNLDGLLVIFLYGGFGVGLLDYYWCFFDLVCYCIVLFDQCGVGCFMLFVEFIDNIIWYLVVDIEVICEYFGIECWVVFGGLWGFMLVLVYVQVYFECVLGLVLCGIFFGCEEELCWFNEIDGGVWLIFFEWWVCFVVYIFEVECDLMLEVYWCCFSSDDECIWFVVVQVWSVWEGGSIMLVYEFDVGGDFEDLYCVVSLVLMEVYYFCYCLFLEDNQLLCDIGCICYIFVIIVYGCYDIICLMKSVWDFSQVWFEVQLCVVLVGYSVVDLVIVDVLVSVIDVLVDCYG